MKPTRYTFKLGMIAVVSLALSFGIPADLDPEVKIDRTTWSATFPAVTTSLLLLSVVFSVATIVRAHNKREQRDNRRLFGLIMGWLALGVIGVFLLMSPILR